MTYRPDELGSEALAAIDVTITVTSAALPGVETPTPNATLREHGVPERPFIIGTRRVPHVRHHRRYSAAPLPDHRWFDFRGPDGAVTATAPDIATFKRLLESLDARIIAYHLARGDFSRWITGVLRDRHLAATASAIERDVLTRRAADIRHARERLGDAIDARYRDVAD